MNKEEIIKELDKQNRELGEDLSLTKDKLNKTLFEKDHYKHLYSEVKKQKDELEKENNELQKAYELIDKSMYEFMKQKDDVVEYIKNETEELENKIDDYAISKYVKRDLLRMLGEIDVEDNKTRKKNEI